jgi:pimeloyl-ACP methyl ester carboxylesterase
MPFTKAQGHRIEYDIIGDASSGAPTLVFLHEGLGSLALWRDFPAKVARAAGCRALVYSRYGYGQSDPITGPRGVRFMHDEALLALPELLDQLEVVKPVLFGHSDGASIALIHAGSGCRPVAGVIAMAPHVFVEDVTVRSIEVARRTYQTTDLRDKLRRYHADPDSAFWGWNDAWLDPEFRGWNIEEFLPSITVPVLAIQGADDEYGTMAQVDGIARLAADVETLRLDRCGHSPHRDRAEAVIEAAERFLGRPRRGQGC